MIGTYLLLFWEFFKTGLFAVGGGMATIPFLQRISVAQGWFSTADLANMIAVAESTPGPIGVNTATYAGYTTCLSYGAVWGILGGIVATLGLITPSVIIILIISTVLKKYRENKYVDAAFYGLRAASVGLITAAGIGVILIAFFGANNIYDLANGVDFSPVSIVLAALLLYLTRWCAKTKKLHPVVFIAIAAAAGIIFKL